MRRVFTAGLVLCVVPFVLAQNNSVVWERDVNAAVAKARQGNKPLLVYLTGSERDDDSRLKRDQDRAFRDPRVAGRIQHFVPLRLSRSAHRDHLKDFGFVETNVMELRFVSPDGKPLGSLGANGVAQPDSLAQKLLSAYQEFGRTVYNDKLKPIIEDENAQPAQLRTAIQQVGAYQVKSADANILKVLDRQRLDPAVQQASIETLAALSTKPAVDKLLELARTKDKSAEQALAKASPVAAEMMLADVKADADPFDYTAYKAAGTICKVGGLKPEPFFKNSPLKLKTEELERVQKLVQTAATKWKAENE